MDIITTMILHFPVPHFPVLQFLRPVRISSIWQGCCVVRIYDVLRQSVARFTE